MLCTFCGKTGHLRGNCSAVVKAKCNNVVKANHTTVVKTLAKTKKTALPSWARKDLIHPFFGKKGPKLVWVPKSNP